MRALGLFCCLLVGALVSVRAEPAPDLKKLCDLICGGVWRLEGSARPVENRYAWDDAAGVIRGLKHEEGKLDTIELFGWDSRGKAMWVVQTIGGDLPSVGSAELTKDGFFYRVTLYGTEAYFGQSIRFEGKDRFSGTFSGLTVEGFEGSGPIGPYVRTPE